MKKSWFCHCSAWCTNICTVEQFVIIVDNTSFPHSCLGCCGLVYLTWLHAWNVWVIWVVKYEISRLHCIFGLVSTWSVLLCYNIFLCVYVHGHFVDPKAFETNILAHGKLIHHMIRICFNWALSEVNNSHCGLLYCQ